MTLRLSQVYSHINDTPVSVWQQINDTGNLTLLIKRGRVSYFTLKRSWDGLQNQYFEKFGIEGSYKRYMKLRLKRAKYMALFLKTQDMNYKQQVLFLDRDIEIIEKGFDNAMSFEDTYAWLVSRVGHFSLNETTVYEYYSLLNNQIKQVKRGNNKR